MAIEILSSFKRSGPFPLDDTWYFENELKFDEFIESNKCYNVIYNGMICVVNSNNKLHLYMLYVDSTTREVVKFIIAPENLAYQIRIGNETFTCENGVFTLDLYTKEDIDTIITSVFRYKGSKQTYQELPADNNEIGDTWNVVQEYKADDSHVYLPGTNYAWNGQSWDPLGGTVSNFYTKTEVDNKIDEQLEWQEES